MRGRRNDAAQIEAVRLRVEERLSFREIRDRTGFTKSCLSRWLQNYPLTEEELKAKHQAGVTKPRVGICKSRGERSKFDVMLGSRPLNSSQKGCIAEAAVLFRLTLLGLPVLAPVFDGDRTDWLIQSPSGRLLKLQVKWASSYGDRGLPSLRLTHADGHSRKKRYAASDFDFLVGYNVFTDTAYVFSFEETKGNSSMISIREDATERWDKILGL